MLEELNQKVYDYLSFIVRTDIANHQKTVPAKVDERLVDECIKNRVVYDHDILISDVFEGTDNGVTYLTIYCALVNDKGYHFLSKVLSVRKEDA